MKKHHSNQLPIRLKVEMAKEVAEIIEKGMHELEHIQEKSILPKSVDMEYVDHFIYAVYHNHILGLLKATTDRDANIVSNLSIVSFNKYVNITFSKDLYIFLKILLEYQAKL